MELTLKEIEVQRLNLKENDVLFITLKGEEFIEHFDSVKQLRDGLKNLFPQNKIIVLAIPEGHEIDLKLVNRDELIKELTNKETEEYTESDEYKCDNCDCCCSRDGKCGDSEPEENKGE